MSLEAAIAANTAAIERLTAVLQSQQITPAASVVEEPKAQRASRKKADTPTDAGNGATGQAGPSASPTAAPSAQGAAGAGASSTNDSGAVRYFHIAAHNTVAAVEPGGVVPSIPGMVEVGADEYASLKAKYTTPTATEGNGATGAVASPPAAAASTPTSAPSPSAATATTTSDSGNAVMELAKQLHARDGNEGLKKLLDKFGVGRVGELVAATAKHTDALAYLNGALNPQPQTAGADLF